MRILYTFLFPRFRFLPKSFFARPSGSPVYMVCLCRGCGEAAFRSVRTALCCQFYYKCLVVLLFTISGELSFWGSGGDGWEERWVTGQLKSYD